MSHIRLAVPFAGDTVGGSHISDIMLMEKLQHRNVAFSFILHEKGALADYLDNADIDWHDGDDLYLPRSLKDIVFNFFKFLSSIRQAKTYIKQHHVDIVYCSDGPLRYIWFYAAKAAKVKFVLTQHALPSFSFEKNIAYRLFDGLVANSQFVLSHLPVKTKHLKKFAISRPIVERDDYTQSFDIPCVKDAYHIGYIANIHPMKRPFTFLRMAKELSQKYDTMRFYMVGTTYSNMGNKIQQYIQDNHLEDRVFLLGFQTSVHAIMKQFDVIVAPSVGESFGRIPVEAALLEVPVIASNSGGHKETIIDGETGFLVNIDEHKDFAKKVEHLYHNQDLSTGMATKARKFVQTTFAPQNQVDVVLDLLQYVHNKQA